MRSLALVIVLGGVAAAAPAASAPAVSVTVFPPDNLADASDPMPSIYIRNESTSPIEIQIFGGAPAVTLEAAAANGTFAHDEGAMCGNGFTPHQIAPGEHAFFPLWTRIDHGAGKSGTYRVVVPFAIVAGKARTAGEAVSAPFELAYGDVAPLDKRDAARPGQVVVVSAEREHNSALVQPSPAALATKLLPAISRCVAAAQKRLPWLRGRFSLEVYQYGNPKPTLFVSSTLLGDDAVNKCLGALAVTDTIPSKYEMTFAISPPTP